MHKKLRHTWSISNYLSITVSASGNWWRYDVENGQKTQITNFGPTDEIFSLLVTSAIISPDGNLLVSGGRSSLYTYDIPKHIFKKFYTVKEDLILVPILWNNEGILLAQNKFEKYFYNIDKWDLILIDPIKGNIINKWPNALFQTLGDMQFELFVSPKKDAFLSIEGSYHKNQIYIFKLASGRQQIASNYYTYKIAWTPDGKFFNVVYQKDEDTILSTVFDMNGKENEQKLLNIVPHGWSFDGNYVFAEVLDLDGNIKFGIVHTSPWEIVSIFTEPANYNTVAWSPNADYVVYHSTNFEMPLYHPITIAKPNGETITIDEKNINGRFFWSPDGKYVYYYADIL